MRCLYCGESLSLLRKLKGLGEFCSEAHRDAYQQEFNSLALGRLRQTRSAPSTAPTLTPVADTPPEPAPVRETPAAVALAEPPSPPEAPYLTMTANTAVVEFTPEFQAFPAAPPSTWSLRLPLSVFEKTPLELGETGECEIAASLAVQEVAPAAIRNPIRPAISFPGDDIHLWMEPLTLAARFELGRAEAAPLLFEDTLSRNSDGQILPPLPDPFTPEIPEQPVRDLALSVETEADGPGLATELEWNPVWNPRPVCDPLALDFESNLGWTQTVDTPLDFEDRRFEFVFRPVPLPEWVEELKNTPAEPEEKPEAPATRPRRIISARPRSAPIDAPRESAGANNLNGGGVAVPPGFVAVPYAGPPVAAASGPASGAIAGAPAAFAGPVSGAVFVAQGVPVGGQGVPVSQGVPIAQGAPIVQGVPVFQGAPIAQGTPLAEPSPHVFHMPPAGGSAEAETVTSPPLMVAPSILSSGTMFSSGPVVAGFATAAPAAEAAPPAKGVGVTVNTTVHVEGATGSVTVQNGTKVSSGSTSGVAGDHSEAESPDKPGKSQEKPAAGEKRQVVEPASFLVPNREPLHERTLRLNPKPLLQAAMPVETPHLDTQLLRRPVAFGPRFQTAPPEPARSADSLRTAAAKTLPAETDKPARESAKAARTEKIFREESTPAPSSASSRNLKLAIILLIVTALIAFAFWKFTAKSASAAPPGTPPFFTAQHMTKGIRL